VSLDGRYRAVLDRIEEDTGVLLVENDRGDEVIDERHVDAEALPPGVEDGAVLTATFEQDGLRHLVFEPAETERRRSELGERFDRLAERPPESNGGSSDERGTDSDGEDANADEDST